MELTKSLIKKYLADETAASKEYAKLARDTNDEEIMELSQDEAKHREFWKKKMLEVLR